MFAPKLEPHLYSAVLRHLHISPAAPDLRFLDQLLGAYVRTVPWESAFRIVKRARTTELAHLSALAGGVLARSPAAWWWRHLF